MAACQTRRPSWEASATTRRGRDKRVVGASACSEVREEIPCGPVALGGAADDLFFVDLFRWAVPCLVSRVLRVRSDPGAAKMFVCAVAPGPGAPHTTAVERRDPTTANHGTTGSGDRASLVSRVPCLATDVHRSMNEQFIYELVHRS